MQKSGFSLAVVILYFKLCVTDLVVTTVSLQSQADAEVLDGLTFRPSVACGGKLSTSEYNLRSRKCTEEQLSR